jgi:transposase
MTVACRRLMTIPGIGPIIANAMVATIGDGSAFRRGRDFGAWLRPRAARTLEPVTKAAI